MRFSGKEEDFEAFSEQFEAKLHLKKLRKTLINKELKKEDESDGDYDERLEENRMSIWCELVQCLDTKMIMMLKPQKHDGPAAWAAMQKHFKSSERPRVHQLLFKLTNIKLESSEELTDYLIRNQKSTTELEECKGTRYQTDVDKYGIEWSLS